jgi:DHA2 family multidrug resistance protein-like MFS transporter
MVSLTLSVLVVGLDVTILNVALPSFGLDLGASTDQLQWFVASYSIAVAAALLPFGLLGDRLGRKKVLIAALVLFGASSLACSYATTPAELIVGRILLGLGAAAILPLTLAVVPVMFTEKDRPKAITAVTATIFLSYPVGPLLGGWLIDRFFWGAVFLINVPVVVAAVVLVAVFLPESRSAAPVRLDRAGIALSSIGLTLFTYGVITAGQDGWTDPIALAAILVGGAIIGGFVLRERRLTRSGRQPLIEPALLRSATFVWGSILSTMVAFVLFGVLFAIPQYFQAVNDATAFATGLRLLPLIAGMFLGPPVGAVIGARRSRAGGSADRTLVALGFAVMATGLAVGVFTTRTSDFWFVAGWLALVGAGLGIALPASMNAALGALDAERSGAGSAVLTVLRQVGATISVALLGSILNSIYRAQVRLNGLPQVVVELIDSRVHAGVGPAAIIASRLGVASLFDSVNDSFAHGLEVMLGISAVIAAACVYLAVRYLPAGPVAASVAVAAGETVAAEPPAGQLRVQPAGID